MRNWSRPFALALLALGLTLLLASGLAGQARAATDAVAVLTINGPITPVVAQYIERGLTDAERAGVRAVVIKIDTPGGLDTSMRAIIQRILASKVPVITYVSPSGARAASAGAFISYAAHIAAMAPSTTIGSASPVSIGSDGQVQEQSETMTAKVTNDAVSYIRGLAERRGRNADWAEQAVRKAANLSASEALSQRVVDIVAVDLNDLLRQANGREVAMETGTAVVRTEGASPQTVEQTWPEAFLHLIADPTIAYLLLSLGMLGIYLELSNPGSILPGVTGAILLLVGLFALGSLPVNWAGALLMLLAFVLFAVDLYAPTHGALTIGGIVAFVLGSIMLINTQGNPAFEIVPGAIAALTIGLAGFSLFVSSQVWRDRRRKVVTGQEALVGALATARGPLMPTGMVTFHGERWRATSRSGRIDAGQPVRVVSVSGLDLIVEAAPEQPAKKE